MKPGRTVEMTGPWKTRKTKPRFPFVSHGPWKSLRDFHIPTAPARRRKVENRKQVSHFPTRCSLNQINQERRPLRRVASLPPSGSSFNEKMLRPAFRFYGKSVREGAAILEQLQLLL